MTSPQVALDASQSWWLFPEHFKKLPWQYPCLSRCNCSPAQGAMPMTWQECLLFFVFFFSNLQCCFLWGVFASEYVVCHNHQVSLREIKLKPNKFRVSPLQKFDRGVPHSILISVEMQKKSEDSLNVQGFLENAGWFTVILSYKSSLNFNKSFEKGNY